MGANYFADDNQFTATVTGVTGVAETARMAALSRAKVLSNAYSLDLTRLAAATLGAGGLANRDVQALLEVHLSPGVTPGALAERTGRPSSAVSRSLRHLQAYGLIQRDTDLHDRRSSHLTLTRDGHARVRAFEAAAVDYFATHAPLANRIVSLLGSPTRFESAASSYTPLTLLAEMASTGAAFAADVDATLTPLGVVEASDRMALSLIHDRGPLRPRDLTQALELTPAGVAGLLDRLERHGMLRRTQADDASDGRAVLVSLTPAGEDAAVLMLRILDQHADETARVFALAAITRRTNGAA